MQTEFQAAWGRVPSLREIPWQKTANVAASAFGESSVLHPAIAALFALPFAQTACRTPLGAELWPPAGAHGHVIPLAAMSFHSHVCPARSTASLRSSLVFFFGGVA